MSLPPSPLPAEGVDFGSPRVSGFPAQQLAAIGQAVEVLPVQDHGFVAPARVQYGALTVSALGKEQGHSLVRLSARNPFLVLKPRIVGFTPAAIWLTLSVGFRPFTPNTPMPALVTNLVKAKGQDRGACSALEWLPGAGTSQTV